MRMEKKHTHKNGNNKMMRFVVAQDASIAQLNVDSINYTSFYTEMRSHKFYKEDIRNHRKNLLICTQATRAHQIASPAQCI